MPSFITLLLQFSSSLPQREIPTPPESAVADEETQQKEVLSLMSVCVFQALDALKTALQQEPSDPAVRAELHFSMGNQLREMNELDRAFQVTSPAAVRVREALFKYSLSTHSCLLGCSLPTDSSWTI